MTKENKIKPLPAPEPQICPKCNKEYHDNKWGGCGICSCGYYFHPEWYSKKNEPKITIGERVPIKEDEGFINVEPYVPDPNLTEEELMEQVRKYGKIK